MLAAWHASSPLTLCEADMLPLPSDRWEWHLSTRHNAAFLSKPEGKWPSTAPVGSERCFFPASSPTSDLLSLFQASKSWLSSLDDVVHPSFLGSSVVSQGSHSSLGLGTLLLLQLAPEETALEWGRTSLFLERTLTWHLKAKNCV